MYAFLGTVDITRRLIKNFAEFARPLLKLTEKVVWRWTQAEQLSFELLRIKCAIRTSIHGIDLDLEIHIYTNASGFAAGCVITQFQPATQADTGASKKEVEVPILYESFTFGPTQRNYLTYKGKYVLFKTRLNDA